LAFGGILTRLVFLQVKDASAYQRLAERQRLRTVDLPATRGAIFDRNHAPLAVSLPAKAVFADPSLIEDRAATARTVAQVLGIDERTALERISAPPAPRFVYLDRLVPLSKAQALADRELPGIGFLDETSRNYPAGSLAPQVIGYLGVDGAPLAGLEYQYQRELAGKPGHAAVEADPNGVLIPQGANVDVPPVPGQGLILTLDRDIQFFAQQALRDAVKTNHATRGTVVVMDPRTGEILAMASYPWFDLNRPRLAAPDTWQNRAVTDIYEPGSVNKVITAAAALEEGIVRPSQRITVPPRITVDGKTFEDPHPHPTEVMTLGDILAHSSNLGTIEVAQRVGKVRLASFFERFRMGSSAGLGFPGEATGKLRPLGQWDPLSLPTFAIGEGIAVTPLQMASVYATVANGGVWVQPKLVKGFVEPDGSVRSTPPSSTTRVISGRTANLLTQMLGYAVRAGTGTGAQIPNFWVAGKTGTARKPKADGSGYEQRYMASFIGFTPATRPALVIAAVLDSPATEFGGIAAAPLFQTVGRAALARLHIAPEPPPTLPPHAQPLPG
jgi:cell division protein FtsI (penicillin-binding protein 3)